MQTIDITGYYCAVNELAAMLADGEISFNEWRIQHAITHHAWH